MIVSKANTFGRLNARQLTNNEIVQVAGGSIKVTSGSLTLSLTGPDITVQFEAA